MKDPNRDHLKGDRTGPLPESGHGRREELKARQDNLEEKADKLSEYILGARAEDLQNFPIENDVARHFTIDAASGTVNVSVSKANPMFVYAWICEDFPRDAKGLKIREQLSVPGWEIVVGDMPEGVELKDARGYRKVGDTVLMRCRKDRYLKNVMADRQARAEWYDSADAGFDDVLELSKRKGVVGTKDLNDPRLARAAKQALAKEMASREFTKMIKEGRVPTAEDLLNL